MYQVFPDQEERGERQTSFFYLAWTRNGEQNKKESSL